LNSKIKNSVLWLWDKTEIILDRNQCFAGDSETVKMLRELSASLIQDNKIKDIEELSLDLKCCYMITNNGLSYIGREIGTNFSSVEKLEVKFSGALELKNTTITNDGVIHFGRNLFPYMKKLKHLTLQFSYCEAVANVGLKTLVTDIVMNLKNLESLHLIFVCCNKITKEGFGETAVIIPGKMMSLKSLTLDFYYCSQIPKDFKERVKDILIKKVPQVIVT